MSQGISSLSCLDQCPPNNLKVAAAVCVITAIVTALFLVLGSMGLFTPAGNLASMAAGGTFLLLSLCGTAISLCKRYPQKIDPQPESKTKEGNKQTKEHDPRFIKLFTTKHEDLPTFLWKSIHNIELFKATVERALNENVPLANIVARDGETIFHCVARAKNALEMLKYLEDKGVKFVNRLSDEGCSALHVAAFWDSDDGALTSFFIERNANLNELDKVGRTPLHYACGNCNLGSVKALVKHGAKTDIKNSNNQTALALLPPSKKDAFAQYLEKHNAASKVGTPSSTSNTQATKQTDAKPQDLRFAELLTTKPDDLPKFLLQSIDNIELFKATVDRAVIEKVSVADFADRCGDTIFHHLAGKKNAVEMLKYLEDKGVKFADRVNKAHWSALHVAAFCDSDDGAPTLFFIERKANLDGQDRSGDTPLHCACENGKLASVRALVEHGAKTNIRNNKNNKKLTPLEWLKAHPTSKNNREITEYLEKHNTASKVGTQPSTSVTQPAKQTVTTPQDPLFAVMLATPPKELPDFIVQSMDNIKVFKAAVDRAVKEKVSLADFVDESGDTIFHRSVRSHNALECLKYLKDKGIKFTDPVDKIGNSVLHVAATWKIDAAVISFFLAWGADPNKQSKWGNTPLHNACSDGKLAIVKALVEQGAKTNIKDKEDKQTPLEWLKANPTSINNREIVEYLEKHQG